MDDTPRFKTVKETAKILKLGINQTYNAIHAKEIRAVRFGGSYRVPDAELDRLQRGEVTS